LPFVPLKSFKRECILNSENQPDLPKGQGQTDEGIKRKVFQEETGLPIFKPLTLISTAGTRTRNQLFGQTSPCWMRFLLLRDPLALIL